VKLYLYLTAILPVGRQGRQGAKKKPLCTAVPLYLCVEIKLRKERGCLKNFEATSLKDGWNYFLVSAVPVGKLPGFRFIA
jgi:hypothetical protein